VLAVPRVSLSCVALALVVVACGHAAAGERDAPAPAGFQVLVASPPDPEGNSEVVRFDSATGRTEPAAAPGNATAARFAAGDRLSYLALDGIHSEELRGGGERTEATGGSLRIAAYAWSSSGALAYLAQPALAGSGRGSELVIELPGGPTAAVTLTPAAGWGGEAPQLRFSPDGSLLLLVDRTLADGAAATLQVRRLDGRLVFGPVAAGTAPGDRPSDAAWSGRKLYFWDGRGVNVADLATGATRTILPGVRWYHPDVSPDGRTVVFERRDGGTPRLELLDTATDAVVPGFERDGATQARFVGTDDVWFHEVAACAGCAASFAQSAILSLDTARLTERRTGLSGIVTDVRRIVPARRAGPLPS
jgi:hypothetical protein